MTASIAKTSHRDNKKHLHTFTAPVMEHVLFGTALPRKNLTDNAPNNRGAGKIIHIYK
jgi:hypothetical protein